MTQVLWPSSHKFYSDHFWPDRIQLSRRLRQIGQELFHLRQSNRHREPVLDGGDDKVARISEARNHVLKTSSHVKGSNGADPSRAHNIDRHQEQNVVQEIVCDDEVVFKTTTLSATKKLPPVWSENVKNGTHSPIKLARRALRHEFEAVSSTPALEPKDLTQHAVAANITKPTVQRKVDHRSSPQHRKRSTLHRSIARKRTTPSALTRDSAASGNCDSSVHVGIRTRRMSVAEVSVNQKPSKLSAAEDIKMENRSRLSSVSTAAVTAYTSVPTEVTVPSWRVLVVPRRYVMEGTEDLTDEAYIKRHQRLEVDEKRRKRWDLQRQRELSAYEHLRRDDVHNSNIACQSRCSSDGVDDVSYIELADDNTGYAFGHAIPHLGHRDFQLPPTCRVSQKHRRRRNSTHFTTRKHRRQ